MKDADYIWQRAIIIEHQQQRWIEFPRLSACARCRSGKGCGAGVFGLFFAGRKPRLLLPSDQTWQAGDGVRVGISSSQMLRASAALYLFPLLCFMLGALLGEFALAPGNDWIALFSGFALAVLGLLLVRSRSWRFDSLLIQALPDAKRENSTDGCLS